MHFSLCVQLFNMHAVSTIPRRARVLVFCDMNKVIIDHLVLDCVKIS